MALKATHAELGGGGILRDHFGHMVMAFAEFYGQESNNVAEAKAIHTRIQWCNWNNYIHSIIESDSLIIINMIKKEVNLSWKLKDIIEQIWDSNISGNFKFQHCLREGNMVADFLANWGERMENLYSSLKLFLYRLKLELL